MRALTTKKYSISTQGTIPFVAKKPGLYAIKGEIWVLAHVNLSEIDMLEGHPHWYKRELVPFKLLNPKKFKINKARLYFNKHSSKPHKIGDFRKIARQLKDY